MTERHARQGGDYPLHLEHLLGLRRITERNLQVAVEATQFVDERLFEPLLLEAQHVLELEQAPHVRRLHVHELVFGGVLSEGLLEDAIVFEVLGDGDAQHLVGVRAVCQRATSRR